MKPQFSPAFLDRCRAVTAKRPKTVIDHVLEHGSITTDELRSLYGYDHAPRAARDVREQGIAVVTKMEAAADGRRFARYFLDEAASLRYTKRGGRTTLDKKLKAALIVAHGSRCFIYGEAMAANELQVDHRIPYEVIGDSLDARADEKDFMLLSPSANRAKSWSCEQCENWLSRQSADICRGCYWAFPEDYTHVAMIQQRRLDLLWSGGATVDYDGALEAAKAAGEKLPDFVKAALRMRLKREPK